MAASRSFSKTVRFFCWPSAFLTNCWVIVEPPWVPPPPKTSLTNARPMPRRSMPELVKKRRSSMAMIAWRIAGEISS